MKSNITNGCPDPWEAIWLCNINSAIHRRYSFIQIFIIGGKQKHWISNNGEVGKTELYILTLEYIAIVRSHLYWAYVLCVTVAVYEACFRYLSHKWNINKHCAFLTVQDYECISTLIFKTRGAVLLLSYKISGRHLSNRHRRERYCSPGLFCYLNHTFKCL